MNSYSKIATRIAQLALVLVLVCSSALPQTSTTFDPPLAVVLRDRVLILKQSEAEAWYKLIDPVKDRALHVALTHALGTAPVEQKCITWEQHVAEVTSWWAAPEREYVECDDPGVGPR